MPIYCLEVVLLLCYDKLLVLNSQEVYRCYHVAVAEHDNSFYLYIRSFKGYMDQFDGQSKIKSICLHFINTIIIQNYLYIIFVGLGYGFHDV